MKLNETDKFHEMHDLPFPLIFSLLIILLTTQVCRKRINQGEVCRQSSDIIYFEEELWPAIWDQAKKICECYELEPEGFTVWTSHQFVTIQMDLWF